MEYYVSYHKLIKFFEQVQQNSPRLQSFGHGDIVYFSENLSGQTNVYPYMFVTPQLITYNESTTQYQLSIIFADIVNTDLSNEVDVVSDMSIEAKNMIAEIYRGFLFDKIDLLLPVTAQPFLERFNDHVGGVSVDITITIFDDINACVMYETSTPTPTPTITPTPTCPVTTQYLEVNLGGCHNFTLSLFNDSGFTSNANALCDYTISGTAYGDLGTVYNGTEVISTGQHQHSFNLNPVLQPGECVSGFTVNSYTTSGCTCPINLILP